MNALNEAARGVNNAWCKGDLRKEAESKDSGDQYCSVSHLALSLAKAQGLELSIDGEHVGFSEMIDKYNKWFLDDFDGNAPEGLDDDTLEGSYTFIDNTTEGKLLADTIKANFSDRLKDIHVDNVSDSYIIWNFNDHGDTTREEVISMMEKAAASVDEQSAFEEKTSDDLVAEMDELLNEKV